MAGGAAVHGTLAVIEAGSESRTRLRLCLVVMVLVRGAITVRRRHCMAGGSPAASRARRQNWRRHGAEQG